MSPTVPASSTAFCAMAVSGIPSVKFNAVSRSTRNCDAPFLLQVRIQFVVYETQYTICTQNTCFSTPNSHFFLSTLDWIGSAGKLLLNLFPQEACLVGIQQVFQIADERPFLRAFIGIPDQNALWCHIDLLAA